MSRAPPGRAILDMGRGRELHQEGAASGWRAQSKETFWHCGTTNAKLSAHAEGSPSRRLCFGSPGQSIVTDPPMAAQQQQEHGQAIDFRGMLEHSRQKLLLGIMRTRGQTGINMLSHRSWFIPCHTYSNAHKMLNPQQV